MRAGRGGQQSQKSCLKRRSGQAKYVRMKICTEYIILNNEVKVKGGGAYVSRKERGLCK